MSRIGDFFKTPHSYNNFFNSKIENDETAKIRREINKLNKLIEQKSDELFTIYGEMYGDGFTPAETPTYLVYSGRSNSSTFDVSTLSYVEKGEADGNYISVNTKMGVFSYVVGYCYNLGSAVVRNCNYTISQDCKSIKMSPRYDYLIPLVDTTEEITYYDYKEKEVKTTTAKSSGYRAALQDTKGKEFINSMYEIERDDLKMKLIDVYEGKAHPCHEIILKTCPADMVSIAYKTPATAAVPMNKLFDIEPNVYKEAEKLNHTYENFLYRLCKAKGFLNGLNPTVRKDKNIERTDQQLLDLSVKAANYEEDLKFYNIGFPTEGVLYYCLSIFSGNDWRTRAVNFSSLYPLGKFMNYICSESVNQGYTYVSSFVSDLKDYIYMALTNGSVPTLYSSYLKLTHDIASRNFNIKVTEEDEKIFESKYKDFTGVAIGDYCVIPPRNSDDVKNEGNALNHCVASYIKRVIDDKCIILFLRLRKEMDKSLVTVEIEGNRVIQARGMSNRNITNDERKALVEYCKRVGYDMKTN